MAIRLISNLVAGRGDSIIKGETVTAASKLKRMVVYVSLTLSCSSFNASSGSEGNPIDAASLFMKGIQCNNEKNTRE